MTTAFAIVAVVAGLSVAIFALYVLRAGTLAERGRGSVGVLAEMAIPSTALQRLARWGLAIGLVMTAGLMGLVGVVGPDAYTREAWARLSSYAMLMAGLLAYLVLLIVMRSQIRRGRLIIDERDREILARAPALQSWAVLACVAAWMIILTEVFRDSGSIPVVYIGLMFWSCLLVHLLALPLGILWGYTRR